MDSERRAERFFIGLMVACTLLLMAVLYPLWGALFLAAVFAGVLFPAHRRLARALRNHKSVAAGALVLAMVIVIVGPLGGLSAFVIKEGIEGVKFVQETVASEGVVGLVERLPDPTERVAKEGLKQLSKESSEWDEMIEKRIQQQGARAASALGSALSATGSFLFQAGMMLIALFFLLAQGEEIVAWLDDVSPLRPGQTRELFAEFRKVAYSLVVSSVITAGIQALVALIGYYVARVPHPIFFGAVTFMAALIPAVGASFVCVVAAALLLVTGHPYAALFLVIWGIAVVGVVDNLVKPLLMRAGMQMHGAVVFFSLVGGLAMFGPIGLLLGPVVVSLFLTLIKMHKRDFAAARAKPVAVVGEEG
jgi:predicted PurR-regulated permease PerM